MPSLQRFATHHRLRRVAATIAVVFSLAACQSQSRAAVAEPTAAPAPASVVISIGEETSVGPGSRLRLLRMVSDSRCPKGVQCVWAGEVTLEFELSAPSGKKKFQLAQARAPGTTVGTLAFELKDYQACPAGTGRLADAECATVAITAAATR